MAKHPFHEVAVVGVHNTQQARVLEGHDSRSITFAAGIGAISDAGMTRRGCLAFSSTSTTTLASRSPNWMSVRGGRGAPLAKAGTAAPA